MKRTNYQLFDFLDFDPEFQDSKQLWIAENPTEIQEENGDVFVEIPFQKQKPGKDLCSDKEIPKKVFRLQIRAYGTSILRISLQLDESSNGQPSGMLHMDCSLKKQALKVVKKEDSWLIEDVNDNKRAVFNFKAPETDFWSDLLPPPENRLQLSLYPDGKEEVSLNSSDHFFSARVEAMPLAFIENKDSSLFFTFSLSTQSDEHFVGTGERFSKMDLSGQTFQLKNQDGQGVNNKRTYKNIPFYLSSRGYGLFVHTSAYTKFSLADHSTRSAQILVEEPALDWFLIGGETPERILYGYRQLTGFPIAPPKWSYGIWMSRMTYFSAEEVNEICQRIRREHYPCDVIHLDTGWFETDWLCEWKFNKERFPNPEKFIGNLKANGFRVSLWQMPYIAENAEQYEEAREHNYIAPLKDNQDKERGSNFSALDYAGTIDFTFPEAVEWYKNLIRDLLKMGVACIKTDFGEEIHLNAEYKNMKPELLNNLYALLYQKAAYEVTKEETGEGIIWARAGWAGCQRYPLHWGGDASASWEGMAGSLKGGLHLGLSGFGFWSHDVPGFHGVPNFMNSVIPDDLYVRWTQFGVFSSHIRYHGTSKREPWHFPKVANIIKKWWKLRYLLIPYIKETGTRICETGFPMLRALLLHHPEDKMCWHIDNQYYFGESFLVAPVMNSANRRDVYLPEGEWVNFFSGEKSKGGKWLKNFETPLDEMPVWVKSESVISIYPEEVDCTDKMIDTKIIQLEVNQDFIGIWNVLK